MYLPAVSFLCFLLLLSFGLIQYPLIQWESCHNLGWTLDQAPSDWKKWHKASNNTDIMDILALCSAFYQKTCSFNLCVHDLLLWTTEKQPHVGRNVTVVKQFTAEFCYNSTLLQFKKLQAADDTLKTQWLYAVQRQVKSMIYIVFEIWIHCSC